MRCGQSERRCGVRSGRQLETRPPFQGGGGGGRVSFAACPARRTVTGQEGQAGGRAGRSCRSAGGRDAVFGHSRRDGSLRERRDGERGPAAVVRDPRWCSIQSNTNEKRPRRVAQLATSKPSVPHRETAAGSLRRPFVFKALRAQLAATERPLRPSALAMRSTSAKAAARASVMHLASTALRP